MCGSRTNLAKVTDSRPAVCHLGRETVQGRQRRRRRLRRANLQPPKQPQLFRYRRTGIATKSPKHSVMVENSSKALFPPNSGREVLRPVQAAGSPMMASRLIKSPRTFCRYGFWVKCARKPHAQNLRSPAAIETRSCAAYYHPPTRRRADRSAEKSCKLALQTQSG